MLLPTRSRPYVCLPCQFKPSKYSVANRFFGSDGESKRTLSSNALTVINDLTFSENRSQPEDISFSSSAEQGKRFAIRDRNGTIEASVTQRRSLSRRTKARGARIRNVSSATGDASSSYARRFATAASAALELSDTQRQELRDVQSLRQRLHRGLKNVPEIKKDVSAMDGLMIEDILKILPSGNRSPTEQKIIAQLGKEFNGQTFAELRSELDLVKPHQNPVWKAVTDPKIRDILTRLGIIDSDHADMQKPGSAHTLTSSIDLKDSHSLTDLRATNTPSEGRPHRSLARMVGYQPVQSRGSTSRNAPNEAHIKAYPLKKAATQTVAAADLTMLSVETQNKVTLPQLSFDLSRVLFNPGVYQLQDPRSRVYNFDPYLEHLMPVSEFNFGALNPYTTSSEDEQLQGLAKSLGKKYVGSSSSMTSILSQFHFIISQWRELNTANFTRGFDDILPNFTHISRAPAAIFLRYRDGVYAVDADKEFDEPNILMGLGQAMEKLLTLEKREFEKWRKSSATVEGQQPESRPEAFHYSQQGQFLLRSQLDVHDPRLPGTGYFDLKTRAVVGVRNLKEQEAGMGYQIKTRFGEWESYEREYYDMMRSTFLKYSLQARMGFMDGIFVAYHNISRIFGFQYIPLSEMDIALHGQSDQCLGDQEYRFSINFLEEIFNQATQTYPEQSLRIHFETREATVSETQPYMHIYIQPMTEDDIQAIQASNKAQFDSFERKMLQGEEPEPIVDVEGGLDVSADGKNSENDDLPEGDRPETSAPTATRAVPNTASPASNAADKAFMDKLSSKKETHVKPTMQDQKIMAFKLTLQNQVNGRPVTRPTNIGSNVNWTIDYHLQRLGDDQARKLYIHCHNRRMAVLKAVTNRGAKDYFSRSLRELSSKGAEWRKQQDELDAQREKIVLYEDRLTG